MNFEELIFSQDYNYSEDYSIGHGSGHGSAPVQDDEDDSPVEEVSPSNLKIPRDVQQGPKRMSPRSREKIGQRWKRPRCAKLGAMCQKIILMETNHESGTNDLDMYHKACAEYKMMYKQNFTLEHCYNILKDRPGWKDVEMPAFYNTQGRKKSKTCETTSGSASGGLNLNEGADEAVEDTQEFRLMGRDRAKAKKKAAVSSRGGSSSFVDLVADKFFNIKQKNGERRTSNNSPT
ncbi:retrotransposon protein, putative, ty3-gypsy subclass [Tanacetum coccineum]|uniref:Retrotransposon protein, putative, ty3-gypsy subclass n=1 Tax=Tanacetum coccineum TaxID=301880 RepID=A0ABQ4XG50_9ASTR